MNKRLLHYVLVFSLVGFMTSCKEDKPKEQEEVKRSDLSAGKSTTYTFTSVAFDTPADWLNDEQGKRFLSGDGIYDSPRNIGDDMNGGLGPLYNGYTCAGCHKSAGRTRTTLRTEGGTGTNGYSTFLADVESNDPEFVKNYGGVLHDQATVGNTPEAKISVTYTEETFKFDDGEEYKLQTPHYTVSDWWKGEGPHEMSVRVPLRHVGMGMIMAIDRNMIKELATKDYSKDGISGRVNYLDGKVGLIGHKAQNLDLTVELSFASDMGTANKRFPQESKFINGHMDATVKKEVADEDMADVDFYLHTLGVPARRNVNDPVVVRGEQLFKEAKCDLCHTPTLRTRPEGATLIDGTVLAELGNQEIHPFSDFLLHDMGPELGDNVTGGMAEGNEWRTTPLWGIGLQDVVNGHTDFMHDSRARNYVEAIMWHGGEGEVSRKAFKKMPKADRDALVAYLRSL